jgi:hypothetical protein
MAIEGVEGCAHAQSEVAQYPSSGAFSPKVAHAHDLLPVADMISSGHVTSGDVTSGHVTSGCFPLFPHKYDFVRTHILLMYLHLNNWEFLATGSHFPAHFS